MKKIITPIIAAILAVTMSFSLVACSGLGAGFDPDKQITVIARDLTSGTREAFDTVVGDGETFLQQKENGERKYYTTKKAVIYTKTGDVITKVLSDKNSIGYVSLGSVPDNVKLLKVESITPSKQTVLSGDYKIQRPFVIMTNSAVTLTPIAADFMKYLQSSAMEAHCDTVGTVFMSNAAKRGSATAPIEVVSYAKQNTLPSDGKINIKGSTSMEKLILAAAAAYAKLYNTDADDIFDVELQGSSVGRSEVKKDTRGNVIGLSSSAVNEEGITSFNVCLDAVAVIVNTENTVADDLTLKQLFEIYTGKITTFGQITK